jgi:hypothetical protein
MGDRKSREALQWFAYISQRRSKITYAGNGREVHLAGLHNLTAYGYCKETNEDFENLGFCGTGVLVRPIDTSTLVKQMKHY